MKTLVRFIFIMAVIVFALLLVVRFAGSPWATSVVNRKLSALPQYTGQVESVQIALWRGTVSTTNLRLLSRGKESDGPVVSVRRASLSFAWLPLFRGVLGGHGVIDGINVMIVNESGVDDPDKKEPPVRQWQNVLRNAFPMEITRFEIKNARIAFDDRSTHPAAEMIIDQFELVATDFSNRPKGDQGLPAHIVVKGQVGGSGRLNVDVHADPSDARPHFTATMEIKDLALVPIHDFLVKNALIDVSSGTFEVFTEVNASAGHYDGYIKPFFKDLEFKAVPDPSKNIAQRAATKIASTAKDLLKNDHGQVATKLLSREILTTTTSIFGPP
jgi:Domain of Unknown Function (DUF748)